MTEFKLPPKLDKNTSNYWDIVLIINWIIDYLEHNETTNKKTKG